MNTRVYYKLICIDQQHAIISEQQLSQHCKIKAKRLGRAVIVSINIEDIEPKELAEINYLLASVRVHAMAYDDNEGLSQYDMDELEKM